MADDSSQRLRGDHSRDTALSAEALSALLRVSHALSKHRDREALFAAIAEAVADVLPAERLVVLVPDVAGAAVSVYAVRGARKLSTGDRIPAGSLPAWVIERRQPVRISSPAQVREQFPATYRKLTDEAMQSAAVLPLLLHDRCIGALSFMASAAGAFDGCPQALLDGIADAVAVALEGCLAYEQLQRQDQER
jgi:transcriptional regulator with GAF, ATPase, and Fis domain